mmetsp:Transcript_61366/g.163177  ORF Transcript_61366/g.163177 Transcript_61366/m.163177 type:complete len:214 (+) Transcript_61366:189-830(+)
MRQRTHPNTGGHSLRRGSDARNSRETHEAAAPYRVLESTLRCTWSAMSCTVCQPALASSKSDSAELGSETPNLFSSISTTRAAFFTQPPRERKAEELDTVLPMNRSCVARTQATTRSWTRPDARSSRSARIPPTRRRPSSRCAAASARRRRTRPRRAARPRRTRTARGCAARPWASGRAGWQPAPPPAGTQQALGRGASPPARPPAPARCRPC